MISVFSSLLKWNGESVMTAFRMGGGFNQKVSYYTGTTILLCNLLPQLKTNVSSNAHFSARPLWNAGVYTWDICEIIYLDNMNLYIYIHIARCPKMARFKRNGWVHSVVFLLVIQTAAAISNIFWKKDTWKKQVLLCTSHASPEICDRIPQVYSNSMNFRTSLQVFCRHVGNVAW